MLATLTFTKSHQANDTSNMLLFCFRLKFLKDQKALTSHSRKLWLISRTLNGVRGGKIELYTQTYTYDVYEPFLDFFLAFKVNEYI